MGRDREDNAWNYLIQTERERDGHTNKQLIKLESLTIRDQNTDDYEKPLFDYKNTDVHCISIAIVADTF